MTGPKDPLGPPREDDPWYVPPDFPRFTDPTPTPAPASAGHCPHCDAAWTLTGKLGRARVDDFAVCGHCGAVAVFLEDGSVRLPAFDELLEAEQHPGVRFLMQNYAPEWMCTGRGTEDPQEPPNL